MPAAVAVSIPAGDAPIVRNVAPMRGGVGAHRIGRDVLPDSSWHDARLRDAMTTPDATHDAGAAWYADHVGAGEEVVRVFSDLGVPVQGKRVADIGSGDGIIDLAIARAGRPAELVGYDVILTNRAHLLEQAIRYGGLRELPPQLRFEVSEPEHVPAADACFDLAVSWSAFEHIWSPAYVAREIHRILVPGGLLFLQLWPFFPSQHGSHLWDWFPDGYVQHRHHDDEIKRRMDESDARDASWREYMFKEYRHLNRLSLDDLQRVLLAGGFDIIRAELISNLVVLAPDLARYPLSDLLIEGVKLVARARPAQG
jgi:SAM-dependent methyltransferase